MSESKKYKLPFPRDKGSSIRVIRLLALGGEKVWGAGGDLISAGCPNCYWEGKKISAKGRKKD